MSTTVGFIGLGAMGLPMAQNLLKAGYALQVYNRTGQKAAPLQAQGAALAAKPADLGRPGAVVITMVADDSALEEVVLGPEGFGGTLGPEGIHLSMSTVSPTLARNLASHHRRQGAAYLAAPVFGRPDAAAARKLWICLSGPAAARERARPVLEALGQGIFEFGEDPSAAHVVKLAGNFLIMAALEAMAEAFTLAEKSGIDRTAIATLMGQTLFACPIYQNYGKLVAAHQYQPAGFRLPLGLKDVTLALQAAADVRVPMPLASLVRDRLLASLAKGRQDLDWSALALEASEDAGLKSN